MQINNNLSDGLREQVADAFERKTPLYISAGKSKSFYGNKVNAQIIDTTDHSGIIEYQTSELVVTVRSGTLLSELEAELKANKQMLAFEPPQHTSNTTIGGAIACGLSGPRRVACGSARDFVLGTTIINGKAEKLRFGGQVMKNVAGYDASRLMVGAQGTLGVLLDVSLKVLPTPETEISLKLTSELSTAIKHIQQWVKQGLPITASCYLKGSLYLRLGSTNSAVKETLCVIKKVFDTEEINNTFWLGIKNQTHDFFTHTENIWRCSHQTATEFYADTEHQLIEWNGALRWVSSDADLHSTAAQYNGHATRYPININNVATDIFQPIPAELFKIQQRLKRAFDPENILNPNRLYTGL